MKATQEGKVNSGTVLLVFFAILVGLAGTYAVRVSLAEAPQPEPPPPPPIKKPEQLTIPLASRDLPAGTEVALDDIALFRMTREEVSDSIGNKPFMTNPQQIIGKVLANDLKRGKTFDTQSLLPAGKLPGVAQRLKPGQRAVAVTMSREDALLGFASPGQLVDVLFHFAPADAAGDATANGATATNGFRPGHHDFNPPRRRDYYGNTIGGSGLGSEQFQGATSTLVQGATILALGLQSHPTELASPLPEEKPVTVTLAVDPRQAELLRVASGHGELSLTLRSPEDQQQVALVDPVTLDQIINVDQTIHEMEIFRGTSVTKVHFGTDQSIRQRTFVSDRADTGRPSDDAVRGSATEKNTDSIQGHNGATEADVSREGPVGDPFASERHPDHHPVSTEVRP